MINAVLASAVLLGARAVVGQGSAIVINACSYPVQLQNTPSSGGGYDAISRTLSAGGGSYSQQYTELTNGNGWSLKLSKSTEFMDNILQYEYTYHPDEPIWYDLSEVNGNPWDSNWEITATSGCTPRQAAYRYATDDAYGMQSCDNSASITVTLCSGDSSGGNSQPAPSSPPETSWAAPTSAAPVPSSPAASQPYGGQHSWAAMGNKVEEPSTLVTSSVAWNGPAVTVTNVAFETVTEIVTAHHQHHRRHPHHMHV